MVKKTSSAVYSALYRNIINMNIVPGSLMSEKEISEKMNVSRTPVREAFIRLSNDALVSIVPQKGTFVSKINLLRVQEERFIREAVAIAVMSVFMKVYTEKDLKLLKKNIVKQEKALLDNDVEVFVALDDAFHEHFYKVANKNMCYEVVNSYSSHYKRVRNLSTSLTGVTEDNIKQHRHIYNAICSGDTEEVLKKLKQHLRKVAVEEKEITKKYPEYFLEVEKEVDLDSFTF